MGTWSAQILAPKNPDLIVMTIAQVYGPWSGTATVWADKTGTWALATGAWADEALTWAQALQAWGVSYAGTPRRLFDVGAEIRVVSIDYDDRILPIDAERRIVKVRKES
jgi:hypothetical protein